MVSVIITCAGKGLRAGFSYNKLLKKLDGITPFEKCLSAFSVFEEINQIIITTSESDREEFTALARKLGVNVEFVIGGSTRAESVKNGLSFVKNPVVLIHDGARPFVSHEIISSVISSVEKYGDGVCAIPSCDTLAKCENGIITSSFRKDCYQVQTPQGFKTELIVKAYENAKDINSFTDDSGIFINEYGKCHLVNGDVKNKKLTFKEDFCVGKNLVVGTGFDLHVLVEDRKLILGGIEIPHDKGLLGHSDADVLTHAIMDAMLSGASLGDIGRHFPDTDMKYKDISSMFLLEEVKKLLIKSGYEVVNVSAVIMAQKPKLAKFVETIKHNLATALCLDDDKVGITCTTLEGIGTVGREEGIAVQSYCLLNKALKD